MTISVIIAAYNAGRTISHSLQSIFSQTTPVSEVIVVDDGSSDDTAEVVKGFPGVRYICQENRGPANARNNGVKVASGDFVAFLDSDDYWEPCHIDRLTGVLKLNPDLRWAASAYRKHLIEGGDKTVCLKDQYYIPGFRTDYFTATPRLHFLSVISTIVRRDLFLSAGGFAERYSRGEDLSLWLRLAILSPLLGYSPEPTAVYEEMPHSLTSVKVDRASLLYRIADDYALVCKEPEELQERAWPVFRPWIAGLFKKSIRSGDAETLTAIGKIFGKRLNLHQRFILKIAGTMQKAF
jgi:glycosyltransferase involved in cell wall biosynthesis